MHRRVHRRDRLTTMLGATAALAVTRTALAQVTPAGAIPTGAYLQTATGGGLFLKNTARDAHAKATNPGVKKFARAEVVEQVNLARKIDADAGGAPIPGPAAAAGPGGRAADRPPTSFRGPLSAGPPAQPLHQSEQQAADVGSKLGVLCHGTPFDAPDCGASRNTSLGRTVAT